MERPLIHPHELARLAALHSLQILDSLPEAFSDAIASAAAAIAGVPISAISLVDTERQWFKSSCGLSMSETPRDLSICAHALYDTGPFLIEDAREDERFRDNLLVVEAPFVRAYAGFPLLVDGHPVGALCVMDDRPRRFEPEALRQLGRLAEGAASWLQERRQFGSTLQRNREQLREVTFTDAVTGLPSRLMLQDRLAAATARCDRDRRHLAVLFIRIGEARRAQRRALPYGSEDEALREVARRLRDIAPDADLLSRVGDDDFVIVCESGDGTSAADTAARLAGYVRNELRRPVRTGVQEFMLDAAIGAAVYPQDGPVDRLVGHAALACNRPEARTACCWFSREIADEDASRRELLAALRYAAPRDELALHYQPKFDAASSRPTGAEALLRWRHPRLGDISPGRFIPLAEDAGLIGEIGDWVIGEALRQMGEWQAAGAPVRVAINLSARQLQDPLLAEKIATRIAAHRVDPALLTFEITESVAMEDVAATRVVFAAIKACGVALSIDDFGTGYSSLAYLRQLRVDQLKIDRSFVADLENGDDAHLVAKAIVELGHALRMEVVAEGVETVAQQMTLRSFGCDKLQGFLLARPMPAPVFGDWWQQRLGGEPPSASIRPTT